ncbi:MAG: winged helix-turn-helix domain-containing protein [Cyclobacteriaceae bacterium]|jgi:DNA-binding MarR family transcriptional regulator|nr:transcriptional regulator [Flammeovirgaceae bacterium]
MKNPFDHLDRILEHRVRLQIMGVLTANDSFDFVGLKELLQTSDGNLATHLKALEREKYILVQKSFVDRKPNTRYKVTERGKQAFRKHLDAMEEVIRAQRK